MQKHNLLSKKIKKQFLSINNLLERYFFNLSSIISNFKKTRFTNNNRVFLGFSTIAILTLIYFLIPLFYNNTIVKTQIKNQVLKKYNIDLKFTETLRYRLLPSPHFYSKNLLILADQKEVGIVENSKIFISKKNFFSINNLEIKDITFSNAEFNIYKKDLSFFLNLLKTEPNENDIKIIDSNIFFKNKDDEVLFINKIYESNFGYDFANLVNKMSSKNEIFNISYKILIKNDKFNKKLLTKFISKDVRLNIQNEIDYNSETKKGLIDLSFMNKSKLMNYSINKESLIFYSDDKKNFFEGAIDFKPFYFSANFNYESLSSKNLLNYKLILIDLVESELFNNKNLNAKIDLNVKDITNINVLNDLNLNINIEEGNIFLSNSNIMWKDDLKISFKESLVDFDKNEISLIGKIVLDFDKIENFYKSFQIKKKSRKKIKQIQIDFVYNFDQQKVKFDNVKIDNKFDSNLQNFLDDFNMKNSSIFNKILFKNFVSNFFNTYSG